MTKLECRTGCVYGPTSRPDVVLKCSVEIDEYSVKTFNKSFGIIRHDNHALFIEVST